MFAESNMHYYRTYVQVHNRPDQKENIGYIKHCRNCGNRGKTTNQEKICEMCGKEIKLAGPLWIGEIFNKEFIQSMISELPKLNVEKNCIKTLEKARDESEMPVAFYTLDEIASRMNSSPLKLEKAISCLRENNFIASPTSFSPTGFRTNATINEIIKVFQISQ